MVARKIGKYGWLLVLTAVMVAGVTFLFFRLYHNDLEKLNGFTASYRRFDKTISDLSSSQTDGSDEKAGEALAELKAKSAFRISSLIKNDALLMGQALEVSRLAAIELNSLRAYKEAIESKKGDLEELAETCSVLTRNRRTAYARFRELGGIDR